MKTYTDRTDNKVYSWIIAIGLHLLLLLMFFFASMTVPEEPEDIQGIIVNFGTVEAANASETIASTEQEVSASSSEAASASSQSSAAHEKVIEQEIEESNQEDALALSTETKEEEDKAETENTDKAFKRKSDVKKESDFEKNSEAEAQKEDEKTDEQKLVDRLFTRKSNNNGTATQGNNSESQNADQGQETVNNNQESNNYESNLDTELAKNGVSYSLNGRYVTKQPVVKKGFQKIGRVVVNIKVNQAGEVIAVEQNLSKSTTNDAVLVTSALQSARTTKFNQDFNAMVRQSGTISFEYKVR